MPHLECFRFVVLITQQSNLQMDFKDKFRIIFNFARQLQVHLITYLNTLFDWSLQCSFYRLETKLCDSALWRCVLYEYQLQTAYSSSVCTQIYSLTSKCIIATHARSLSKSKTKLKLLDLRSRLNRVIYEYEIRVDSNSFTSFLSISILLLGVSDRYQYHI